MLKNKNGGIIMIIRKKTVYLVSLVLMLVMVGFINHKLSKETAIESSEDYQGYEEELMEVENENSDLVEVVNEEDTEEASAEEEENEENIEVVDSTDTEVENVTSEVNKEINSTISNEKNIEKSNYFVEYRVERDKMRAELIDRLKEIVNNEGTSQSVRDSAQEEIIEVGNITEKELLIEGLVKSKGFEDALVLISDNGARIVINKKELSEKEVMQILEIVTSETDLKAADIKVMSKQS
ncbi:SpoIIIAH-like family protein [Clostridium sp. D2Q-14]|uniref:SpoIIIAH-like family protein n=1 Tax=Anaeromonas gelatinilytica TaxID=2683194 RepID=UPI00193C021A|nr:SpoIIIAH-like family protein [Anaeromonas gelatinilytica]MBS4536205.1 SpoIIIAH-like family protein [Anaeromonas gelatinilytica]